MIYSLISNILRTGFENRVIMILRKARFLNV